MKPVPLTTARLRLTMPTLDLVDDVVRACTDPETQRWTTVPRAYGPAEAEEFLGMAAEKWEKDCPIWAIYAGEMFVGIVDLFLPVGENKRTEIGFWAHPDARGNGYMTEAVRAVCQFAFDQGCYAIGWSCLVAGKEANWASARVAWRNGFIVDGIRRAAAFDNGRVHDHLVATLVAGDPMEPAVDWFGPSQGRRAVWNPRDPEALVREFHETYGMPIAQDGPEVDRDRTGMRMALIAEEFHELVTAVYGPAAGKIVAQAYEDALEADDGSRDTVEAADALADLVYVIYGMALETGIPLDRVLREVQAANLSKLGADGRPIYREDGKVLKGPDYFRPRVDRVLGLASE
ncbi:GNAT family N-acetyltransferase [Flaviflexus equikiangi]|uniref:GNAT family N-acetyltransferase n=1 Tax=Flaviflexus equikiangi TaxID=2758573 RepID=A0ABS2TF92_9ACTO|nr:GNAT family N-acetyltransferase [Flaviflexus equikiangi]MBM9433321.1 GNAT family N-acetyltransferase [Flaviflexus equikiangi]